jgi:hypothetical protein
MLSEYESVIVWRNSFCGTVDVCLPATWLTPVQRSPSCSVDRRCAGDR